MHLSCAGVQEFTSKCPDPLLKTHTERRINPTQPAVKSSSINDFSLTELAHSGVFFIYLFIYFHPRCDRNLLPLQHERAASAES